MPRYRLRHTTRYRYTEPATLSRNEARLTPRTLSYQRVEDIRLEVLPTPEYQSQYLDAFGNVVSLFNVNAPHDTLDVTMHAWITTLPRPEPPVGKMTWEECRDRLAQEHYAQSQGALPFLQDSTFIRRCQALADWLAPCLTPGRDLVEMADALNRRIFEEFTYDPSFSTLETTSLEVIQHKRGVCQDYAHLAIAALRSVGLAARYVSGYLETAPPPGQPRLIGSDASHAWFSVLIPEWGWLALDPTNGTRASEQHPVLSWGRDYADVAPLKGVVTGGGMQTLEVEVDVIPEDEVAALGL
ncbi:transglutaminase family protein [Halomonas binhaiensis]|uniref:Transglutaminase family protein n=1 Tax=Halomonas binhaiensis TaxID=2562282 RepID=A0A5C1NCI7_9GAMM|nr:transglutaminase family protein [Halomonas binhaiensis]QEM80363.1 transglutaminase family protein [Halomonas binhaiensis]